MTAISSAILATSNRMRWLSSVTLSDMFRSGLTSLANLAVKSTNTIMSITPITSIIFSLLFGFSLSWTQAICQHLLGRTLYSSSLALCREGSLPTLCICRWSFLNLPDRAIDLQLTLDAREHLISVIRRFINHNRSPYAVICTKMFCMSIKTRYILQKRHNILINQTWLQNCQAVYQGVISARG